MATSSLSPAKAKFIAPPKTDLLTTAQMSDDEIKSHLQLVTDELAIRDLTARFSDSAVTCNFDAFHSLWTPDGIWRIGEPLPAQANGADAITKMLERLMGIYSGFFVQMTHSGVVRVDGDNAESRWIIQETGKTPDGTNYYNNFGIYEDKMVRVGGKWLFAERNYEYVYVDHSKLPGQAYHLDAGLNMEDGKG